MKRREFICILGGIAAGFWPGRGTIVAAMAALVLLPIEVSDAGRLSHTFKSSSKHGKSPKHVTSPINTTPTRPVGGLLSFAARADASCLAIKASNDLASRGGNVAALRPRLPPQHLEANPDDPRLY